MINKEKTPGALSRRLSAFRRRNLVHLAGSDLLGKLGQNICSLAAPVDGSFELGGNYKGGIWVNDPVV